MNTSKTKNKYQIAIVPGDGIGKEVMEATLYVLEAFDIDFDYVYGEAGDECLQKNGCSRRYRENTSGNENVCKFKAG